MNPPESLPAKMFVLAFDLGRERLTARDELGYFVRAAALADLVLSGRLRDEGGKAVATGGAPGTDPVLDELWHEIEAAGPRSWRRLVESGRRDTFRAVRGQLADARVIRLEDVRILGLFPATRVFPRDNRYVRQVGEQVRRAIRGGQPAGRVEPGVAALAALAAAGQLRVVLCGRDRRQYRDRLDKFAEPVEPVARALRRAIRTKRAAAASSG